MHTHTHIHTQQVHNTLIRWYIFPHTRTYKRAHTYTLKTYKLTRTPTSTYSYIYINTHSHVETLCACVLYLSSVFSAY